jgi:hypothetical protein
MVLAIGKSYVNRIGVIVRIALKHENSESWFEDDSGRLYKESGKYWTKAVEAYQNNDNINDLLYEFSDNIKAPENTSNTIKVDQVYYISNYQFLHHFIKTQNGYLGYCAAVSKTSYTLISNFGNTYCHPEPARLATLQEIIEAGFNIPKN